MTALQQKVLPMKYVLLAFAAWGLLFATANISHADYLHPAYDGGGN